MTKGNDPKTTDQETKAKPAGEAILPRLALVARHDDKGGISIGVERWNADSFEFSPAVSKHKSKGSVDSEIRMILIAGKGPPLPYFVFDSNGSYPQFIEAVTLVRLTKTIRSLQVRFDRIAKEYGAPANNENCVRRLLSGVAVASADPEKSEDKKADRLLVRVEWTDDVRGQEQGVQCDSITALVKA